MTAGARTSTGYHASASDIGVVVVLVLVIILGGSVREAYIATAALEILACLVLTWCLLDGRLRSLSQPAIWLLCLVAFAGAICLLQIAPLPHAWWSTLPGRAAVSDAFSMAGVDAAVSQPLSLAPDRTLFGTLRLLPPLAVFVLAAKLSWKTLSGYVTWSVVLLAALSGTLALAQTIVGVAPFLFPYGTQGSGQVAGLFHVASHQATFQLMAIPFICVLFGSLRSRFDSGDRYQALGIVSVAALMLTVTGLFLSGSPASYAMLIPVLLLSGLLATDRKLGPVLIVVGIIVTGAVAALANVVLAGPLLKDLEVTDLGGAGLSSREVYERTLDIVHDYWPVGAGLGAFESAYPAYENAATVTASYVTHAHNDYLEVAAELGAPGCVALAGVIIWWGVMTVQAWRASREKGARLKRAASLAVGVLLVQSLIDSPARTEAIACLAALCLAVMSSGASARRDGGRHAETHGTFAHRHLEL